MSDALRLAAPKDLPDLILCDLVMPIADGDDPSRAWQRMTTLIHPVRVHDRRRGHGEGAPEKLHAPALLPKPLDTDVLLGSYGHCQRQGSANQKGFSGVWQRLMGGPTLGPDLWSAAGHVDEVG